LAVEDAMQLVEAVRILREHEAHLKKMGVKSLYMFGSTVRGEQRPESDVDLFFDHDKGELDLVGLINIKDEASRLLGCAADIMTRNSLHPLIRKKAETSALQVF